MEEDMNPWEAWLKETCRELYRLSSIAEATIKCDPEFGYEKEPSNENIYKTRMALQIITGCDEEDAIDLVNDHVKEILETIPEGVFNDK